MLSKSRFGLFVLTSVVFSASAHAAFLTNKTVDAAIQSAAYSIQQMELESESADVQNKNYSHWIEQLISLKSVLFKSMGGSTCQIHVEQLMTDEDKIQLVPSLVDSKGNKKDLSELTLNIQKRFVSYRELDDLKLFIYEAGARRDCTHVIRSKYKTPQLSGVLDENSLVRNIYSNFKPEARITSDADSTCYLNFTVGDGKELGDLPSGCYFEILSDLDTPSRLVSFKADRAYFVKLRKGTFTYSSINEAPSPFGAETLSMTSVSKTDQLISLALDQIPPPGLYQLNEDSTLSALDPNLNPVESVGLDQRISVLLMGSDASDPDAADFSDPDASLLEMATTLNYNTFLTSVDLGTHPLNQKFCDLLTEEARLRIRKIVTQGSQELPNEENLKTWFPHLEQAKHAAKTQPAGESDFGFITPLQF